LEDSFSKTTFAGAPLGAVRHERDLFAPSMGAQAQPVEWLAVRGNVGRYERAPNFTELFGARGFGSGNSNLKPEKGLNRDIGFQVRAPRLRSVGAATFEYSYFNNDADDLIVFVQNSANVFVPMNIGAARLRGHEVVGHTELLRHVAVDLNYTR